MSRPAILGSAQSPAHKIEFLRIAVECGFDLGGIAKRLQVSERTVTRFIRLSYDRSTAEWLKEQRLNKSLQYLARYRSVKYAALEAGFKQPAHFSREFKKAFHVTPSAYLIERDQRNPLQFER